ncbi:ParB/RepB/Spo0J family partition protein, partial [Lachnospiraceae bacterium]|nr:ParB/RepB/Spo0J family partition protein [Lachnospiraceae bacterium]
MTNTRLTENPPKKKAANISTDKLHTFDRHPFQVIDNEEMNNLAESIRAQGIISPLIVRPIEGKSDEYEVISGHRRLYAAVKAGLTEVPALIYPLDRNQAVIAVVDSNLHREKLLPSEKAFAYKMKLEAMKKQGKRTDLTLSQAATKS